MKVLFYIQTCKKYYGTRFQAIKDTYLKRIAPPHDYLFMGDDDIPDERMVKVDNNTYENSANKHIQILKYISKNKPDFDYYFYADDDCYIFINRLLALIESQPLTTEPISVCRRGHYNEACLRECNDVLSGNGAVLPLDYPGGGAGFLINNATLIQVSDYLSKEPNPPISKFGDVAYGFWFKNSGGVKIIHSDFLQAHSPRYNKHGENEIRQNLTYHYLSINEFYELEAYN